MPCVPMPLTDLHPEAFAVFLGCAGTCCSCPSQAQAGTGLACRLPSSHVQEGGAGLGALPPHHSLQPCPLSSGLQAHTGPELQEETDRAVFPDVGRRHVRVLRLP